MAQAGILIKVPAGGVTFYPHTSFAQNGVRIMPSIIYPDRVTPIGVLVADNQTITFANPTQTAAEALFYIQVLGGGPYVMHWRGSIGTPGDPLSGLAVAERGIDIDLVAGVPLALWVDGVNGNDANSGLLPTTASGINGPVATHAAIYRKYPQHWFGPNAQVRINTAGVGGFIAPTAPLTYLEGYLRVGSEASQNNYTYVAAAKCPFVPATGPATAALDVVPVVAVDQNNAALAGGGRSRLQFTAAAPGWTPGDFNVSRDAYLRVTRAGVRLFKEIQISENGADFLIVDCSLAAAGIVQTDVVTIVRPSVVINGPSATDFNATVLVGGGSAVAQVNSAFASNQGATFDGYRFGLLYSRDITGLWFDGCVFGAFTRIQGGSVNYTNVKSIINNSFFSYATCDQDPQPKGISALDPTFPAIRTFGTWRGLVVGNAGIPAAMLVFRPVGSYNTVNGITVAGQSYFDSAATFLLGAGNSQFGLRVINSSQARIGTNLSGGVLLSQIQGVNGNLECDVGFPGVNFGVGAGQWEEVAGYNGNLHNAGGSTAAVPIGGFSRISRTG